MLLAPHPKYPILRPCCAVSYLDRIHTLVSQRDLVLLVVVPQVLLLDEAEKDWYGVFGELFPTVCEECVVVECGTVGGFDVECCAAGAAVVC